MVVSALAMVLLAALLYPEPGSSNIERARQAIELPAPTVAVDHQRPSADPAAMMSPDNWIEITVRPGDTLSRLLESRGVSAAEIHRLVTADSRLAQLARIRPGDTLKLAFREDGQLVALTYQLSRIEALHAQRTEDTWQAFEKKRTYERQLRYATGIIDDSLFLAGQRAGLTDRQIMQLADMFGWDIDFVMDIRRGDSFQVLFETLHLDGEFVEAGHIVMAEFRNRERNLTAFRHINDDGNIDILDEEGNSMRREFLRNPVDFTRISSGFNLNRRHPVLNTIRAHRGVDYAAPTGTPVRSAGDGRVTFAGVRGGYGNVVVIQHGQKYNTLYAHLRSFSRGIRKGSRVRQGETIGYVGMSGLATGPHLHYEFQVNGVHRNPLTISLPKAKGLQGSDRQKFIEQAKALRGQMDIYAEAFQVARGT